MPVLPEKSKRKLTPQERRTRRFLVFCTIGAILIFLSGLLLYAAQPADFKLSGTGFMTNPAVSTLLTDTAIAGTMMYELTQISMQAGTRAAERIREAGTMTAGKINEAETETAVTYPTPPATATTSTSGCRSLIITPSFAGDLPLTPRYGCYSNYEIQWLTQTVAAINRER